MVKKQRSSKIGKIFVSVVFLCLLFLTVSSCGGDGEFTVTGRVYEWTNAPVDAESQHYIRYINNKDDVEETINQILGNIPADREIIPLPGAIVGLINLQYEDVNDENEKMQKCSTNYKGDYSQLIGFGGIFEKYPLEYYVLYSKDGYHSVSKNIKTDEATYFVIVTLLVKERE